MKEYTDKGEPESDKPRMCGALCHHARRLDCNCWCNGLFHGQAGKAARLAFFRIAGTYPGAEGGCDNFEEALVAAVEAAKEKR